jgi:di/tricarboxylate transporter
MKATGSILIWIGIGVVLVGVLTRLGLLNWFGKLPGDVRYEGENTRVYFPIVTMLLVSIVVSVILYLIRRFF